MNKVKLYKIRYKQEFWGEILEDSYEKYCTFSELQESVSALYSDPHVFSVEYFELPME